MVLFNKKLKELVSFSLVTALTNQRILLEKGICTSQEWQDYSVKIGNELQDVFENRESIERMVKRLQKQVERDHSKQ